MNKEKTNQHNRVKKTLLWVAIGSITMFFGGLTSAYLVTRGGADWLLIEFPKEFYYSTALILTSSLFLFFAKKATQKEYYNQQLFFLITTLCLGIGFVFFQIEGWKNLVGQNIHFTDKTTESRGPFLYTLTLSHLIHLAGGVISLIVVIFVAAKKKYTPKNVLGLELASIYWHYLGILWIYLFLFLFFVK